jgi:hypothetical protein
MPCTRTEIPLRSIPAGDGHVSCSKLLSSWLLYERNSWKIFYCLSFNMRCPGFLALGLSDICREWKRGPVPRLDIACSAGRIRPSPQFAILSRPVSHVGICRRQPDFCCREYGRVCCGVALPSSVQNVRLRGVNCLTVSRRTLRKLRAAETWRSVFTGKPP